MSVLHRHLKKIYVDLESLLDTRMGTLAVLDTAFAYEITTAPAYFTREQDAFSGEAGTLTAPEFAELYAATKEHALRSSIKTKMHRFVGELCHQFTVHALGGPHHLAVEVEINTAPFDLTEAETLEIVRTIAYYLGEQYTVRAVCIPLSALSVTRVREEYCAMVMYTYHEWLNLHEREIRRTPLKEVCLYVPRLYFGAPPSTHELSALTERGTDAFEWSQHVLGPLVLVQYLPMLWYCLEIPELPASRPPTGG